MKTELGFDFSARFKMPADEPPGIEGGDKVLVYFEGHKEPIEMVVTKSTVEGDQRSVTIFTPLVVKIEPVAKDVATETEVANQQRK